jgi:uncharacterized protein with HEPN domain
MSRSVNLSIEDIWESLLKIEAYTSTISEYEFEFMTEKQDAVIRRFEIIGEAVKNVPQDFREKYSDVPWKQLAGLRDVVIHQYFGVTTSLIWRSANTDVPKLINDFRKIRENLGLI